MARTSINELQKFAVQYGSMLGFKNVIVYPNTRVKGWDVYSRAQNPEQADEKLLALEGTITECFDKLQVAIQVLERLKNMGRIY